MPDPSAPLPSEAAGERLLAWFERRARAFPWREERTPYRVWVAEIMLQQTRAATVVPYYRRWMERLPTLEALAAADPDEVLALWEGLGYYRRARALHETARRVARDHGGRLPASEAELRDLPGIGPYTAAAIAALAFDARTVAVDGNVRRLGARLAADPAPRDEALRERLLPLVPRERPGRGVEALIELGATVCTPRAPACGACPLAPGCRGRTAGPERFPAPRRRAPAPTRRRWARVHLSGDAVWLVRRPDEGLLGGLWGPPQEVEPPAGEALEPVRQVYSHFRLELVPVVAAAPPADDGGRWVGPAELRRLPLSNVDRAVVDRLRGAGLLGSEA